MVQFGLSQTFHLRVIGENKEAQKMLSKHQNDSVFNTHNKVESAYRQILENIQSEGYFLAQTIKESKEKDTVFKKIRLNQLIKMAQLSLANPNELNDLLSADSWTVRGNNISEFLKEITKKLDAQGYNFSEVNLKQIRIKNDTLIATVNIDLKTKRTINKFIYKGYDKFPKNYQKNIERKYLGTLLSQKNITKISSDLSAIPFVTSPKKPEILFTKDSTTIYLYIKKRKANRFDGFIGLVTDDSNKASINGYIDLDLINPFNKGEQLTLYWKDNGSAQKTFRAKAGLPYIFNSPIGIKGIIEIFSEEDKFQTTTLSVDFGYHINFFTEVLLGYQSNQSATLTDAIGSIKDYTNNFLTSSFVKQKNFKERPELNNYTTRLSIGIGNRETTNSSSSQQKLLLFIAKNFLLHPKHVVHVATENFGLRSPNVLTNELYRFGGLNSIRGFNENTLQANQAHNLMTEYRFYFSGNSYIHSIIDYGFANDVTIQKSTTFKSFGLGLGIASKSGLLQLIYANGSTDDNPINISNSIVHVGYKSSF